MIRRLFASAFALAILSSSFAPAPVAAADSAPIPASMAAVGDSITNAASTGGSLGADAPWNSWSVGTSTTVNSHYLRLQALNPQITVHNRAVSGSKVADLAGQMAEVVALDPDPGYVTVLIGGNDLCTDTVAQMTSVTDFRASFDAAMSRVMGSTTETYVYVVSIPDVYQLWELFKNSWWARTVWASADICQSLLANPTSTKSTDVARRAEVRQRNIDYNTQLREVCAIHAARCKFDENAVFDYQFARSDVSGDYFHPSVAGQTNLASVSWAAGYAWGGATTPVNTPPTAAFTYGCTELACSFTDGSSDTDGSIVSHSWTFGDGGTSTAASPSHTYADGGTYTVSLTVTDEKGATGHASQSVTVSTASGGITLSVSPYKVKGVQHADLAWSGATSTNVDIYRDDAIVATTANDGAYTDNIGTKGGGSYTYKVCEAGTSTCSNAVTASY